jgi:hypothetical protein
MLVQDAKRAARQWVNETGRDLPGFFGAYFAGSITILPDSAEFPASSDVDIHIVLDAAEPPVKLGKFVYQGALLEISFIPREDVRSAEDILGNIHLAGSFRQPGVILDPTGELTRLQERVSHDFAKRDWVRVRCDTTADLIRTRLQNIHDPGTFPEPNSVIGLLFTAGVTTFIILAAGLENPTIRKRYAAVRQMLARYDRLDEHEPLLDLMGYAGLSRKQVEYHLSSLHDVFDAAGKTSRTPFFFASDISPAARPIAFNGSQDLINRGLHREAMYWIAATWSRCMVILHADAPEMIARFEPGYRELLADLGLTSFADMKRKADAVVSALPHIRNVAEEIIAVNPGITS